MSRYKCVIFDLDGTLADTKKGIVNGYKHAAKAMGFTYLKQYENDIIGPSLFDTFHKLYNFSEEKAARAVDEYRRYYKKKGFLEYELYEGVSQLVLDLKARGITLALATTKYKAFASLMLKNSDIYQYFDCIAGSNADGSMSDKEELLKYVLSQVKYSASDCVMAGDRFYDAVGANKTGMHFIRAAYGYGAEEEFENLKTDYCVDRAYDIYDVVISKQGHM